MSAESLPERWAAPGTPGFVDDFYMGNGLPFAYMGLVAGGVASRDGLLPGTAPWPGVDEIAPPLAWYDSSAVAIGEGAGWRGFGGALAELRTFALPPRGGKPRAAFTLVNGSSAVDANGLMLQRGTGDDWLRGGALAEERAGTGLLGRRGAHLWFMDIGRRRGAHTLTGTFSQRGAANTTRREAEFVDLFGGTRPPWVGFEEAVNGESGALSWSWQKGERRLTTTLRRSHDHRESFESPSTEAFTVFSEREGQQNAVEVEAAAGPEGRSHGLKLEWTQARVARSDDFLSQLVAHAARERTAWLAARGERPLAGGQFELQLGGGWTDAPARREERLQLSPSAVWRAGGSARRLRLYAERVVTPVWSDLAPGVEPFAQDAWVAGFEAAAGDPARRWIELGALGSEIGNRALLERWPVRELSLRYGWSVDPVRTQDAMLTLAGGARHGEYALDASGFARVRPRGAQTAQVDPAVGARAGAEAGFRVFAGDLGVKLRLESAWVGERENASLPEYFVQPRALAGYATFGGSLALTLGDARIVLRAANLEDEPHPQVWTDPSSPFPGTPAVGSGRQFRMELAWPLFN